MEKGSDKTQSRLQAILRGAFAGPPTPLKAIPKKKGESRSVKKATKKKKRKKAI